MNEKKLKGTAQKFWLKTPHGTKIIFHLFYFFKLYIKILNAEIFQLQKTSSSKTFVRYQLIAIMTEKVKNEILSSKF